MNEAFWAPSGHYIVIRSRVENSGWIVRVMNFATWKHREKSFLTREEAVKYADLWRI